MKYQVNRFDVCASGMENLRSQDEFLIVADIFPNVTAKDLLSMLFNDVNCCERSADFNYRDCLVTVEDWFNAEIAPRLAKSSNPFDLDDFAEADEECCKLFVYMQAATVDA